MKNAIIAIGLLASAGLALATAYSQGYDAGSDKIQSQFSAYKLKQAEMLASQVEENRKTEKRMNRKVSDIRLTHQEFINEAEKRAEAAIRDANRESYRLRGAFKTCANTISVLGDSEASARADAEATDRLLAEIHEFHVREYTRADSTASQLNQLIEYQEETHGTD